MNRTDDLLAAMTASARRSAQERARASGAATAREAAGRVPRGDAFRASLAADGVCVIAECKRRSPSRGILRQDYDAAAIAGSYEAAGAAAISVLTEGTFFDGSLEDLRRVRAAVSVPVLRKDFISIPEQLTEARTAGADAVLLIVAALTDIELRELLAEAGALQLGALVEVHTRDEFARAVDAGAGIIGVNSRNLKTLEVDSTTFDEVPAGRPAGCLLVAESGLRTGDEIARLGDAGYDAFLVGERFMTEREPADGLRALLTDAVRASGEAR